MVGHLFPAVQENPARFVRLVRSLYGLSSAPQAWWLDITQKLSQNVGNPCRRINFCGTGCSDDGELKGVIGFHVDDFLIAWQMVCWLI